MTEPETDSNRMLNQLTTNYLKMSDHLIKLIELKAHSGEDQGERMISEMLQMGRQTEQLIISISTLAKQLQSDGNNRN